MLQASRWSRRWGCKNYLFGGLFLACLLHCPYFEPQQGKSLSLPLDPLHIGCFCLLQPGLLSLADIYSDLNGRDLFYFSTTQELFRRYEELSRLFKSPALHLL